MKRGFTLLEMLMVLLLISSMLLVVLPNWTRVIDFISFEQEQRQLWIFLRQLQTRVATSGQVWFLIANQVRRTVQIIFANTQLLRCIQPIHPLGFSVRISDDLDLTHSFKFVKPENHFLFLLFVKKLPIILIRKRSLKTQMWVSTSSI